MVGFLEEREYAPGRAVPFREETPNTDSREADAMRKLTFGMNLSLDGYIAAPGDDLGWSVPSDELFQWW
ncbi:MAG TPA: hypothetical protein VHH91_13230, partial [Vicinamibacterales bacterium]|nr:hypothetical protein [Vicinamibacterales bacterium]